jgi:hypothetical protein
MSDQLLNFADLMQALFYHFLLVVFINAAFINDYRPAGISACSTHVASAPTHIANASSLAELILEIILNQNLPDTEGEEDPDNHQDYIRIPSGRQLATSCLIHMPICPKENSPAISDSTIQSSTCTNQTGKRTIVLPALQLHIHRLRLF